LLYASFSRGFKSGSFGVLNAAQESQYQPVTQERVDAWELGAKLALLDAYQLNVAGFYYDYRDKQLLGTMLNEVFGPLPRLINAPKAQVLGGEAELQASPLANLDIFLAGMYLDTKIVKYSGLNEFGETTDFAGNGFNFSPHVMLSASVNYSWPAPWVNALEMSGGLSYNYSGEANASISGDPLFALPSFGNVDAQLGVGHVDGTWALRFWSYNLTNEYQPLSAGNAARSGDSITRYAQMPRTYGVTLRYGW
jgi:iron complex outermembrane recepter protein